MPSTPPGPRRRADKARPRRPAKGSTPGPVSLDVGGARRISVLVSKEAIFANGTVHATFTQTGKVSAVPADWHTRRT